MNEKFKIQQLWQYLKVQDDEILIVRSYSYTKNSDEFIVAKMAGNELNITIENSLPKLQIDKPFRLIQQLDSSKKHVIPSVNQIIQDELVDY